MSSEVQFIAICILLAVFIVSAVVRRSQYTVRPLPALERLPMMVAESIEANRPLHFSFGSATLGNTDSLLALVGAEFFYESARRAALSDAHPLITMSQSSTLPLAIDTLRRAMEAANQAERYAPIGARWMPSELRLLAFAAGLAAMQSEDQVAGNILLGSFGAELALILEAAERQQRRTLAYSNRLEGQAVSYVMQADPLLGDEGFAAASYIHAETGALKRVVVVDVARWVLVFVLLILTLITLLRGA